MEDAAEVARFERVLFVDADRTGPAPFHVFRIGPDSNGSSFSTHSISPGGVLALSRDLFGCQPEAGVQGIRGYAFYEFGEELSTQARDNLERAVTVVRTALASDASAGSGLDGLCEVVSDG